MFKVLRSCTFLSSLKKPLAFQKCPLMSEAFACNDIWQQRLESPLLKKVNPDELYYEIDNKFLKHNKASAIDIDIFTNSVSNDTHLDEIEDLVHKLRLSTEAAGILPSTHHAFIRAFISFDKTDDLLRILSDRLNYGIFPDDFCSIYLMDYFIKKKDYASAARVAGLQMLQEDFEHPLIRLMSLYSCHQYLLNPSDWPLPENENEADDGEEVRVRVKFLRNPYFDDHFDLINPNDIVGKTLMLAGRGLENELGRNYEVLGCTLFSKWDQLLSLLSRCKESNTKIHQDVISLMKSHLEKVSTSEDSALAEKMEIVKSAIDNIETSNSDASSEIEKQLKALIAMEEPALIENQTKVYQAWDDYREQLLHQELSEMKRQERIEEVKRVKEELAKREDELFFFEKEDELDLKIENKRVKYPPKWHGKKKKKRVVAAEYVPPDVSKPIMSSPSSS